MDPNMCTLIFLELLLLNVNMNRCLGTKRSYWSCRVLAYFQKLWRDGRKRNYSDESIRKGRDEEERDLEKEAMHKLAEMAYKKLMACRGSNASKSGVLKVSKQAVMAFVKRTIARCRIFEDTGKSCFSEPALRNIIFSGLVDRIDAKSADAIGVATTSARDLSSQSEPRTSGMRFMHVNDKFIEKHFLNVGGEPQGEHPRLSWVSYLTNIPVIAMIWEGHEAVSRVHKITSTHEESLFWIDGGPTTYSSDSVNRANLDIEMWFRQDSKDWVTEATESKHLVYLPQGKTYGSSNEPFETLRNDVFCDLQPNLHAYFPTDDMSLVVIKPKAFRTGCVGDILTALENSSEGVRGLKLVRKADFPESIVWSDSCTSGATDGDEYALAVVVYFLSPRFHFLRDKTDYKLICFRLEKYQLGSDYIYQSKLGETSLHADFFPYGMILWVDPVGKYRCGMMFEATLVGLSLED